jgi:hypothetical protein
MDSHFIDRSGQSLDIRNIETAPSSREPSHDIEGPASEKRHAQAHDASLRLGRDRRLLLLLIAEPKVPIAIS